MRHYGQYCPIAHALDLVGERWALLVVRELLNGPLRYTDLAQRLPGIGTNILAGRLRDLEAGGVIRKRRLPPPAASTVYELTEYGDELRESLYALARWGARSLGPPAPDELLQTGWSANALCAVFDPRAAQGMTGRFELRVGEEVATVDVREGSLAVHAEPTGEPDAVIETDPATLYALVARRLEPAEAVAGGLVRVDGDEDGLERLISVLSFEPRDVPVPLFA
jgi:DNA-binding HxlR family transcriptional regulator